MLSAVSSLLFCLYLIMNIFFKVYGSTSAADFRPRALRWPHGVLNTAAAANHLCRCFYILLLFMGVWCYNVFGQLISDDEEEREKLMTELNSTEQGMLPECMTCRMRVEANTLNVHKCAGPWPLANWQYMDVQGEAVACSRYGRTRETHRFEQWIHEFILMLTARGLIR